jgi:hypothetical protein
VEEGDFIVDTILNGLGSEMGVVAIDNQNSISTLQSLLGMEIKVIFKIGSDG